MSAPTGLNQRPSLHSPVCPQTQGWHMQQDALKICSLRQQCSVKVPELGHIHIVFFELTGRSYNYRFILIVPFHKYLLNFVPL